MNQVTSHLPVAITMGCPVGVGPEIILKFFASGHHSAEEQVVVIGDSKVLHWCARELRLDAEIVAWQPGQDIVAGTIPVLAPDHGLDPATLYWGRPDKRTGRAMALYIETAVRLLQNGVLAAMTTCPIAKSSLQAAGYNYPGHTEMLADLCQSREYGMMMTGDRLRVTLVTIHVGLAQVPRLLTRESVAGMIMATDRTLRRDFAISEPKIAVAGLNPHAGEDGLFGDEEIKVIAPAINTAAMRGCHVHGPFPPDTVFFKAAAGEYDAVVCMYHDQGLIPFKLLHFSDGVNVTFGLPIVRTSVDHGTAYDIAGKGVADPSSLQAAVHLANRIAVNREMIPC
ncbi:MAG: 4-hydroxythreonine-4-phosphate dehydrogenase PdxA [Thermodesulfobacteriota bacterium]|nr:4-hydroxythreonine-4-phosphate dehydrogenase PdxA [Thermodesulfobacteriota bacterium]